MTDFIRGPRQLHAAAWRGDHARLTELLNQGALVNLPASPLGWTPLLYAAASPRAGVELLGSLIDAGADPNLAGATLEESPLAIAAKSGHLPKVQYLIRAGADPRFRNSHGYTALISAPPFADVVDCLLAAGTDPDAASSYGETALSTASNFGHYHIVERLLQAGADPAPLGWTPLMHAAAFGSTQDLIRHLRSPQGLRERDRWNRTPWLIGLVSGNLDRCRLLLAAGAHFTDVGHAGQPGIKLAVLSGSTALVEWMIARGADLDASDAFGTALMEAARLGHSASVRLLIQAGATVDFQNQFRAQAIHEAANLEIAGLLIDAGANIDAVEGSGAWILKTAAEDGNTDFVRGLLRLGARVDKQSTGETALHRAAAGDHLQVMRLLLDAGADPNACDVDGWTPLHNAWSVEGAQLLLNAGADPARADGLPTVFQDSDPEMVALFAPRRQKRTSR